MKRSNLRRGLGVMAMMAAILCPFFPREMSAQAKPEAAALKFKVGDEAPNFKLQYFNGNDLKDVSLSDYRGKKNVVLAFYIFAFTGG